MTERDPLIGQTLAKNFRLERVLGRGGMAQVYYGRDLNLKRPVAIKVIDARFRDDPAYADRFIKEAQAIATWRHENVVQIFYADNQAGLYFFVMEYIDGLDLGQLLEQYSQDGELMPHADVVRIGKSVASALDYAHDKGIIHRDVKPSNIMISSDNRVVLTDFGLAMDTDQGSIGEVFGSPRYIAPEQARNSAEAVAQSDLYALGVILYEMLTGVVPFDDPSPAALALQHLSQSPPPPRDFNPHMSLKVEAVLLKALSKKPTDRYPTGYELMQELETALQAKTESAELPPVPAAVKLSSSTVADKLQLHQQHTPTTHAYSPPPSAEWPSVEGIESPVGPSNIQRSRGSVKFLLLGALLGLGLLIIGGVFIFWLLTRDGDPEAAAVVPTTISTNQPTDTEIPSTDTPVPPTETSDPPTNSPTPSATFIMPSTTPSPLPPSSTNTLLPASATPIPSTNTAQSVAAEPTILYPNGRRFFLFYDNDGLYIYNASGESSPLDEFTFERLDSLGLPTDRVEGWRFAQYAPGRQLAANWCVKIEIIDASTYSTPEQCQGTNSRITPMRGGSGDFWTPKEGSTHFRVLWDGQEVARCEIGAGICEVFLP